MSVNFPKLPDDVQKLKLKLKLKIYFFNLEVLSIKLLVLQAYSKSKYNNCERTIITWSTKKGAENKSITEPNLDDVYVSMYMYIHM